MYSCVCNGMNCSLFTGPYEFAVKNRNLRTSRIGQWHISGTDAYSGWIIKVRFSEIFPGALNVILLFISIQALSHDWHDDVIKWKHFPRYWPFVRGIHPFPVNSTHKGQRRGALMFSLICSRIYSWVNNREAGDLRRHRAHYDVTI